MIKRKIAIILCILLFTAFLSACSTTTTTNQERVLASLSGAENTSNLAINAYAYLQYIDANFSDRDCVAGENYQEAQNWLIREMENAGYSRSNIKVEDFSFQDASGNEVTAQNISVTKKGSSGKQIIIGAHYDGTGTGDNGSGTALALAAAAAFCYTDTYYDLTFVFFSAEEYGMYGSAAYADNMTQREIDNTQYMINMDAIITGDYCYLYGGIADFQQLTVTQTEAYKNALKTVKTLDLNIRSNPWTFDNPEPGAEDGVPLYPSPTTGDWSDHVAFYDLGIEYIYFEATNWEIGDYDGYEETAVYGPVMNTDKDTLSNIEHLFPGRAKAHLYTFASLLNTLLRQSNLEF